MRVQPLLYPALRRLALVALTATALSLSLTTAASAQTETVMYSFTGASDGSVPNANMIADSAGNYYGTAFWGGSYNSTYGCQYYGCGTVFELSPNGLGGWTYNVIYTFTGGADGGDPAGALVFDGSGNLYGTTYQGGVPSSDCQSLPVGCGVVFELSPSGSGPWTQKTLYSFLGGNDGEFSEAALVFDGAGNLYGTTPLGGAKKECNIYGCGELFKLAPNGSGGWTYSIIHSFSNGKDGGRPESAPTLDSAGDIFVTTTQGGGATACGEGGCGTIVEFIPNGSGGYTGKLLHAFQGGREGQTPEAGLVLDASGNLYGAALEGGYEQGSCKTVTGCGLIYQLSPVTGGYKATIIYTFLGRADGYAPVSTLTLDSSGNLYGTSYGGPAGVGDCGFPCGAIYKLTHGTGGSWTQSVVYAFTGGAGGDIMQAGVTLNAAGDIFGTTVGGGVENGTNACGNGCGVAYEMVP